MHERPIGDLVDALRVLGADIRYLGNAGFPPLAIRQARADAAGVPDRVTVRGDVSSQFTSALLMALPMVTAAPRARRHRRHRRRAHLEAVRRDHDEPDAPLRRGGRAGRLALVHGARGRALREPGLDPRRGRRVDRVLLSRGGRARRRPGARDRRRPRSRSRATSPSPTCWRGWARRSRAATTGSKRAAGAALDGVDVDCVAIPDAAMTLAVVALFARGPTTLTGIASWRVKETDRIAAMATELREARRDGRRRRRSPDRRTRRRGSRRPRSTPTTITGSRCASRSRRSAAFAVRIVDPDCVRKTFPGYFAAFRAIACSAMNGAIPGHRGRRPGGVRQGNDRGGCRRGARLSSARQRVALSAGGAEGARGTDRARRRSAPSPRRRDASTWRSRTGGFDSTAATSPRPFAPRRSARRPRRSRSIPPSGRRSSTGSGRFVGRPASSPTAVTWGPSSFRTPGSRCT